MPTMPPQVRRIWGSPQGQKLMTAMLNGEPKTATHKQTLERLKTAGEAAKAIEKAKER